MNRTIWRLIAHHENREIATHWSRQNERIALGGDKLGDLRVQQYKGVSAIETAFRRYYPAAGNFKSGSSSLWSFYNDMKQGDLVILKGDTNWVVEVLVTTTSTTATFPAMATIFIVVPFVLPASTRQNCGETPEE